jgi:transcriptional regulator with XRE-family HTH domain
LRGQRLIDVAAATDLHPVTPSQLERGERPLTGRSLQLLAKACATPPERLSSEMARWLAFQDGAAEEAKGP